MWKMDWEGFWVEAEKTEDTIVVAWAKDAGGLERGSSSGDGE